MRDANPKGSADEERRKKKSLLFFLASTAERSVATPRDTPHPQIFLSICYYKGMHEPFSKILLEGGHRNSLGRVEEVIASVLADQSRLEELYQCVFDEDAWVRMRAIDAVEKVCRVHPEWLEPYIDRFVHELAKSEQASVQWHLAEIYTQVRLSDKQRAFVLQWLVDRISTTNVDWIVSANTMKALVYFVQTGHFPTDKLVVLLEIQTSHKSNAVKRRAHKLLVEFSHT